MEQALTLTSGKQELLSILHLPEDSCDVAVLLVVGGPQYRVGSHRQFVQLSRDLAKHNIPSLRFDYQGMGDSEGEKKPFDAICDDIKVACDQLVSSTGCKNVVIWGLCDAASAALIYAHKDPRISGLVLLNPWLRSDATKGKTMLKYYYINRLLSKSFWRKLFSGRVNLKASVTDVKGFASDSAKGASIEQGAYQQRMEHGSAAFQGRSCLILSQNDLTAKEFEDQASTTPSWKRFVGQQCEVHRIAHADHTFSTKAWKQEVEAITLAFVDSFR